MIPDTATVERIRGLETYRMTSMQQAALMVMCLPMLARRTLTTSLDVTSLYGSVYSCLWCCRACCLLLGVCCLSTCDLH